MSSNQKHRYFFALWPSSAQQKLCYRFAKQNLSVPEGKVVPAENTHITLTFLGDLDENELEEVKKIAKNLMFTPFSILLDRINFKKKTSIIWLSSSTTPPPLEKLERKLKSRLKDKGFRVDSRNYIPHMTLVRKARVMPDNIEFKPVTWEVNHFVLVKSILTPNGSNYEIVGQWP